MVRSLTTAVMNSALSLVPFLQLAAPSSTCSLLAFFSLTEYYTFASHYLLLATFAYFILLNTSRFYRGGEATNK
eukprot:m.148794 g.148794  ORF g.148794 m.148794 type:complete len:74 (-) comp16143_c0_seq3:26-247(-)